SGTLRERGDTINVRSAPGLDRNILHYGVPGDLVTVEESSQEFQGYRWHRVKFPSNATGWVREDLLSIWPQGCIITCPHN
ncbi:MAG TPA: SH3 domain-containing protein, partial [Cyanobacteria bacterium UBA8543]|nr:SH3 domain-containing protein [Cyanobacteria bacterium UBA8543]